MQLHRADSGGYAKAEITQTTHKACTACNADGAELDGPAITEGREGMVGEGKGQLTLHRTA